MPTTLSVIAIAAGCFTACPAPASSATLDTAVSAESRSLSEIIGRERRHQQQSVALYGAKNTVESAIWTLFAEHGQPGWDGDGAEALEMAAAHQAIALIRTLPDSLSLPEVGVDPDGSVMLDWIASRHRSLTLSVDASGIIPFAWIDNGDRGHGVVRFDGMGFPKALIRLIADLTGNNDAAIRAA